MTLSREALEVLESQIKLYDDLARSARKQWVEQLPDLPPSGLCTECDCDLTHDSNLWWWEEGYNRMSTGAMKDPAAGPYPAAHFFSDGWDDYSEDGDVAWIRCASCMAGYAIPEDVDWD